MTFKSYRAESRADWGTSEEGSLSIEQINCGAHLRIADAVEAMAKHHVTLREERDRFERWYKEARAREEKLKHSNAALRGYITRLKKARG